MSRVCRVFISVVFIGAIILFGSFEVRHITTPYHFPDLQYFPKMPQPENNLTTVEGAALGRYLFYDPILSRDSSFSCGSCHKQSAAFSDAPNRFSKGVKGELMTRNTPALFNLAWHPALFWDGRAKSIEEQIFHPVRTHSEMDMDWALAAKRVGSGSFYRDKFKAVFHDMPIDSVLISKAIAQFLRTLISCNSKYDSVLRGESEYTHFEYEGLILINDQVKGNCLQCHITDGNALGTLFRFSDTGLDSVYDPKDYKDKGRGAVTGMAADNGKFKVPSLRNVALTAPYMHDGRFMTLEQVLDFYSEGIHNSVNIDHKIANATHGGMHMTSLEKQKIIAFLNTMTDHVFINNPEFSNPYLKK